MDSNQVEGLIREGVGRLQDGAGGLTGDAETQLKGKGNEALGAAQRTYGNIKDSAEGLIDSAQTSAQELYDAADQFARRQPLASIGVGILVGLGLGIALGARAVGKSKTIYLRR